MVLNKRRDRLVVGIAGSGPVAENHIQVLHRNSKTLPYAVFSQNRSRVDILSKKYRLKPCRTIEELTNDDRIDVIDICNSNISHYRTAKLSLDAGKHIIVEKPVAFTANQVAELADLALSRHLCAGVVFQKRLNSSIESAKSIINEKIKDVLYTKSAIFIPRSPGYYQRPEKSERKIAGGGVLIYQAIHDIDSLINLFGKVDIAYGILKNFFHKVDVEDTCFAMLTFKSGLVSHIHASTAYNYPLAVCHLICGEEDFILLSDHQVIISPMKYLMSWQRFIRSLTFSDRVFIKLSNIYGFNWLTKLPALFLNTLYKRKGIYYSEVFENKTYKHVLDEIIREIRIPGKKSCVNLHSAIETHRVLEKIYETGTGNKVESGAFGQ